MFWLRRPDESTLERIRTKHRDAPLSYGEAGCSSAIFAGRLPG